MRIFKLQLKRHHVDKCEQNSGSTKRRWRRKIRSKKKNQALRFFFYKNRRQIKIEMRNLMTEFVAMHRLNILAWETYESIASRLGAPALAFHTDAMVLMHAGYQQYHLAGWAQDFNRKSITFMRAIFHWLNIATGDCTAFDIIFLLVQFFLCVPRTLSLALSPSQSVVGRSCFVTITSDTKICSNWSVGECVHGKYPTK